MAADLWPLTGESSANGRVDSEKKVAKALRKTVDRCSVTGLKRRVAAEVCHRENGEVPYEVFARGKEAAYQAP